MGALTVLGVSKRYRYRTHGHGRDSSARSDRRFDGRDFWALRDVDFEVAPGEMFGVIGPNGAGKSTLLRLIGGVGRPSTGTISVDGSLGALLELGSDFHPDLTGRENLVLSGIIAGLTRRQVLQRADAIIDFAELREFIDSPVRTYSSGMLLRLGFSIAINAEPDVLLIDEVLAVGDSSFRGKCLNRVEQLRRKGCAIVVVTHDTGMAAQMCDSVMWLNKGQPLKVGRAAEVVASYAESMDWETKRRTPREWYDESTAEGVDLRIMENRFGSMEMQITDVRLIDARGFPTRRLYRGEPLRVEVDYWSESQQEAPNFGVILRQENDTVLFDETIPAGQLGLETVQGNGSVAINFDRLDLNSGEYRLDVGLYRHDWSYAYDYHWRAYPLTMLASSEAKGAVNPPHEWERSQPRAVRRA